MYRFTPVSGSLITYQVDTVNNHLKNCKYMKNTTTMAASYKAKWNSFTIVLSYNLVLKD
jgi:hypothetical protein